MTPQVKKQIEQVKKILEDNPADANVYILLKSMNELLDPVREKMATDIGSRSDPVQTMVIKQINLIIDIANSIIEFLDIKKANLK